VRGGRNGVPHEREWREKRGGKGAFEGGFSGRIGQIGLVFEAKDGFFRGFSEAKSRHVGFLGAGVFQAALISNRLEIICKVFGGRKNIEGGVGGPEKQGSGIRGQGSEKIRGGGDRWDGDWTYGHSALPNRNPLQNGLRQSCAPGEAGGGFKWSSRAGGARSSPHGFLRRTLLEGRYYCSPACRYRSRDWIEEQSTARQVVGYFESAGPAEWFCGCRAQDNDLIS